MQRKDKEKRKCKGGDGCMQNAKCKMKKCKMQNAKLKIENAKC